MFYGQRIYMITNVTERGEFKFKVNAAGRTMIFDQVRKKFVVNTPEEWVRQNTIAFFSTELGFPKSLMSVEKQFQLHHRMKRTDVIIHDQDGKEVILIECKRPSIKITQNSFDQAFRYNSVLKIPYVVLTNGSEMYCCHVEEGQHEFIADIPTFEAINRQ